MTRAMENVHRALMDADRKLVTRCDAHDIPIEELSTCRSWPCVVCGEVVGGIDQPRGHSRWAEDDLRYVRRSPSGWILIMEIPPPNRREVLVWYPGEKEVRFASYTRNQFLQDCYWISHGSEFRPEAFTHWRPLPDPPEEKP